MTELSPLEEIRQVVLSAEPEQIENEVHKLGADYQRWYSSEKIAAFGYMSPKDVVANHGIPTLIQYIDIKLKGGFE